MDGIVLLLWKQFHNPLMRENFGDILHAVTGTTGL
jgi:hypothetical protein